MLGDATRGHDDRVHPQRYAQHTMDFGGAHDVEQAEDTAGPSSAMETNNAGMAATQVNSRKAPQLAERTLPTGAVSAATASRPSRVTRPSARVKDG